MAIVDARNDEKNLFFTDVGFEVPNKFVVGYALDYNEYFRDLNVSEMWNIHFMTEGIDLKILFQFFIFKKKKRKRELSNIQSKLIFPVFCFSTSVSLAKPGRRSTRHEEQLPRFSLPPSPHPNSASFSIFWLHVWKKTKNKKRQTLCVLRYRKDFPLWEWQSWHFVFLVRTVTFTSGVNSVGCIFPTTRTKNLVLVEQH